MRQRLGIAFQVGLVAGTALGCLEGLASVSRNIYFHPDAWALASFAGPLALSTLCVTLGTLIVGALDCAARGPGVPKAAALAGQYAALLVGIVAGLVAFTWAHDLHAALARIDAQSGWLPLAAAAVIGALGLAGAGAAAVAARTLWEAAQRRARIALAVACLALNAWALGEVAWRFTSESRGLLVAVPPGPPRAAGQRNVLLITIDTLRADRVGADGTTNSLTPAIDRLAAGGALFEQAFSTSSWTLPALASVLTGQMPSQHGAGWPAGERDLLARSPLPPMPTLATALRARGYRTAAKVTNPYLALRYGLGAGFDEHENVTLEAEATAALAHTLAFRAVRWLCPWLLITDRGDTVTARALRWLDAHGHEPFLLWVHYIDPHAPYTDPDADAHTSFRGDSLLGRGAADPVPGPAPVDVARIRAGEVHLTAAGKRQLVALYDREVAYVDRQVARLLAALAHLGLERDTLVVLLSDHGEEFWEHGGVEHGHTFFDEVVRVPLILRGPGVPAGRRVGALTSLADVTPTILDLLGLPALPGVQGTSLAPFLRGDALARTAVAAESMLFGEEATAVRTAQHKYVRWGDGREELYDLGRDSGERTNQAACADLAGARAVHARVFAGVPERPHLGAVAPDATVRAGLRALGYVQ